MKSIMKIPLLLSTMVVSCVRCFVVVSKRRLSSRRNGCQSNSPVPGIGIHQATTLSLAQNERTKDSEKISGLISLQRWYEKYHELSKRCPYPTKAVSASVVVALGSILSQWVEAKSGNVPLVMNWHMIRAFALTGLVFEGPYLHWWYEQLFRLGRFLDSGGIPSRARTLAQILVDETIGVMLFFPSYFVAYEISQSFLLFRAPQFSQVGTRMASELFHVIRTNYLVWPLVSFAIFRRVPEALRVVASSIVAVFWNAYLCSKVA